MLDESALARALREKDGGLVGQQFARYDLLGLINKGGMGAVFRARHRELGQPVALKLLLREDPSAEAVARFKREAKVLAQIKHPNVVGISDLGEENGVNFIAMELIEGRNLHQLVRAPGGELPESDLVVEVAAQMARALAHCHEQGVIHRDVKPHNIILEHGTGRAVLTDFGLVKRDPGKALGESDAASAASQAGAVLGTPSFMAPEQFEPDGPFGSVEPRTDVWGLGATLFFLLTGRPPFQEQQLVDLYHAVTTKEVPRASALRPSIPAALDELCARCLKKQVGERPTMAELLLELEPLEGGVHRAAAQRGLRHTAVIVLLLVIAVGLDIAWLHPARGQRLLRLFRPQAGAPLVLPDEPEAEPAVAAPAAPSAGAKSAFDDLVGRAAAGEVDAMLRLGLAFKDGQGVARDPAKAYAWFVKAAEGGEPGAMFWTGYCLARGVGVKKDEAAARGWLARAAAEAHTTAMYWLGTFMAEGKGGPVDAPGARDWFVKARDLGEPELKKKALEQLVKLRQAHPELGQGR